MKRGCNIGREIVRSDGALRIESVRDINWFCAPSHGLINFNMKAFQHGKVRTMKPLENIPPVEVVIRQKNVFPPSSMRVDEIEIKLHLAITSISTIPLHCVPLTNNHRDGKRKTPRA